MGFKMNGWSAFTKNGIKVEPAAEAGQAKQASEAGGTMTYDKYQEWLAKNPPTPKNTIDPKKGGTKKDSTKQDIVKSPEDQMKDYQKDIQMLLDKGADQDDPRIKSMLDSMERLKQGKNN